MAAGSEPFVALLAAPRGVPVALLHSGGCGRTMLCTDPVDTLAPDIQARWKDPVEQQKMVDDAVMKAREAQAATARASNSVLC